MAQDAYKFVHECVSESEFVNEYVSLNLCMSA